MAKATLLFFLFLIHLLGFSQSIDELMDMYEKASSEEKSELLNKISEKYLESDAQKSIEYANKALQLSKTNGNKNDESRAYINLAKAYSKQKVHDEAISYYNKALSIYYKQEDKWGLAYCLNNIGIENKKTGKYDKAIEYCQKALKMYEELADKKGISYLQNTLGDIYYEKQQFGIAVDYYKKALKTDEESGNKKGIAEMHNKIGAAYSGWGNYGEALSHLNKALQESESLGLTNLSYSIKRNINVVQKNQENKQQSKTDYESTVEQEQKDYIKNIEEQNIEIKNREAKSLEEIEKLSIENQVIELKIKIQQDAFNQKIAEEQYKNEMKQREVELLDKENKIITLELDKKEQERKRLIIYIIIAGVGFLLISSLSALLFIQYNQKKEANEKLSEQFNIIQKQKEEIEKQKNKMLDSINYAQTIQQSMLFSIDDIKKDIPQSFIFFRPKDIVSGDFYWFSKVGNKTIIAAIDCTGHGVPGAFMSMIGNSLLNNIVNEKRITVPGDILYNLHKGIYGILNQDSDDTHAQDGMDMSLCVIDFIHNKMEFAGAMNHLYLVKNKIVSTLKADIQSVGGKYRLKTTDNKERKFTTNEISISKGLNIYLMSDGFSDQYGGPNKKKFGSVRTKELLSEISEFNPEQQIEQLTASIDSWKGELEQIDDMLVIGIKF
jgi:serine phosphatase RsbU (regulator of sigma subunit)